MNKNTIMSKYLGNKKGKSCDDELYPNDLENILKKMQITLF